MPRSPLHLILMPTEKCNFRCTYCYERFDAGHMRPSVVAAIEQLLTDRKDDLSDLCLSWFGGEPLMASKTVLRISQFAASLSVDRFPYSANITTNGYYLVYSLFRELVDAGVTTYQISLDGPSSIHDKTRVHVAGGGTFSKIWANLLSYREYGKEFTILVRLHYSRANHLSLLPLISDFNRSFAGDRRYKILFKSINRLGGPNDAQIEKITTEEKSRIEALLAQHVLNRSQVEGADEGEEMCYAASPTSLVVRSDGTLNKCTVALYSGFNNIGALDTCGNLHIDHAKHFEWIKHFLSADKALKACPLRNFRPH